MYSHGPLHMAEQKQSDQLEPTYTNSVWMQGVAMRTCRKRWTIGRGGERGSGIYVLMAWQDDDDDIYSIHCGVQVDLLKPENNLNKTKARLKR